jgi:hypothetical protein
LAEPSCFCASGGFEKCLRADREKRTLIVLAEGDAREAPEDGAKMQILTNTIGQ